jgi:ArsR family transcriptional regulator
VPRDHQVRLDILALLGDRELCAGDLAKLLGLKRATLSHHVGILAERGQVRCRPQGAFRFFSVNPVVVEELRIVGAPVESTEDTPFTAAFKRIAREKGVDLAPAL